MYRRSPGTPLLAPSKNHLFFGSCLGFFSGHTHTHTSHTSCPVLAAPPSYSSPYRLGRRNRLAATRAVFALCKGPASLQLTSHPLALAELHAAFWASKHEVLTSTSGQLSHDFRSELRVGLLQYMWHFQSSQDQEAKSHVFGSGHRAALF